MAKTLRKCRGVLATFCMMIRMNDLLERRCLVYGNKAISVRRVGNKEKNVIVANIEIEAALCCTGFPALCKELMIPVARRRPYKPKLNLRTACAKVT